MIKLHCTQYLFNFEFQIFIFPAELIPELYETALKYTPNSEDFLTQLFMGYVRIKEYKKQQQVNVRNIFDKFKLCWHRTGNKRSPFFLTFVCKTCLSLVTIAVTMV